MSIYYSGTFSRSAGIVSAIYKQIKLVNLKPVKRIEVQFDPFHEKATIAREFLFNICNPKVIETNVNCLIKTKVVCDRSEPQIKVDLLDKGSVKFLANNLTVLEILQQFNQHISSTVKQEVLKPVPITKAEKSKQKRR